MTITIQYTGQLKLGIGTGEEILELPDGISHTSLAQLLGERHSDQKHLLSGPDGFPLDLQVFVNGSQVQQPTDLSEGDEVLLLSPISGG